MDLNTPATRPPNVPPEAWWVGEEREWELGEISGGVKHGTFRYWRADGTLCNECTYHDGVPEGPFKRFHENGEVSQTGQFVRGELHGTRTWYACDQPTSERMHDAGVSELVRRTEMDYDMGRVLAVRHYDASGRRVLPDGAPYPLTPDGIGEDAEFRPDLGGVWVRGGLDEKNERSGPWTFWTRDGVLLEETEYRDGTKSGTSIQFHPGGAQKAEGDYLEDQKVGVWRFWTAEGRLEREVEYDHDQLAGMMRRYDEAGNPTLEAEFDNGCKHGAFFARVRPGYYADPRVRAERGQFHYDHACGQWNLLDENETVVTTVELGRPITRDEPLLQSSAFVDEHRSDAEWQQLGERLIGEGRVVEALCALARGAGQSTTALKEALRAHTLPLSEEASNTAAAHVLGAAQGSLAPLANALVRGADAPSLLRGIAIYLDQRHLSQAALDYVNAALALRPTARDYYFTRSLIHMSLGKDSDAREDAMLLKAEDPDKAQFLLAYARILFPTFDFWPHRVVPQTYYDNLPERPAQPLEAIQDVAKKYATRLHIMRNRLIELAGANVRWMIPDLSALLPQGPFELQTYSIEMTDGDGEPYTVSIDETLSPQNWQIPELLKYARGEWNALCWLCWSVGMNHVGLPSEITPRRDMGEAAGMSAQRLLRIRDKLHMGGWRARNEEIPGFDWEGIDIDLMSPHLATIAEVEYAEMQAMFKWLCGDQNRSPWQDNLRGS